MVEQTQQTRHARDMQWMRQLFGQAQIRSGLGWQDRPLHEVAEEILREMMAERALRVSGLQAKLEADIATWETLVEGIASTEGASAAQDTLDTLRTLRRSDPFPATLHHYVAHEDCLTQIDVSSFVAADRRGLVIYLAHLLQIRSGADWVALSADGVGTCLGAQEHMTADPITTLFVCLRHELGDAHDLIQPYRTLPATPWIAWLDDLLPANTGRGRGPWDRLILKPGPLPSAEEMAAFVRGLTRKHERNPDFRGAEILPGRGRGLLRTAHGDDRFRVHLNPERPGIFLVTHLTPEGIAESVIDLTDLTDDGCGPTTCGVTR